MPKAATFKHNRNHFHGKKGWFPVGGPATIAFDPETIPVPLLSGRGGDEQPAQYNCDDLRRKITKLTSFGGEMTKAELLRQLGVNPKTLGNFMKMKGCCNNLENGTFEAGNHFFAKYDAGAITIPAAKGVAKKKLAVQAKSPKKTAASAAGGGGGGHDSEDYDREHNTLVLRPSQAEMEAIWAAADAHAAAKKAASQAPAAAPAGKENVAAGAAVPIPAVVKSVSSAAAAAAPAASSAVRTPLKQMSLAGAWKNK